MIEEIVEFYSGIVQLLIVLIVAGGAYLGYSEITAQWHPFWKTVAGGVGAFAITAIFMGPFLVLLDIRNVVRAIAAKQSKSG